MKRCCHKKKDMRLNRDRRIQTLAFVYRSLIICLILLGVVIIGGTIYGKFFNTVPLKYEQPANPGNGGKGQIFSGIGQIRVPTADPQPGTVILFVSFNYYPDDKAFSEELVLRTRDFREIITGYISAFSMAELQQINEENVKAELLQRFNAVLRLGQIESLYFIDFMIVG